MFPELRNSRRWHNPAEKSVRTGGIGEPSDLGPRSQPLDPPRGCRLSGSRHFRRRAGHTPSPGSPPGQVHLDEAKARLPARARLSSGPGDRLILLTSRLLEWDERKAMIDKPHRRRFRHPVIWNRPPKWIAELWVGLESGLGDVAKSQIACGRERRGSIGGIELPNVWRVEFRTGRRRVVAVLLLICLSIPAPTQMAASLPGMLVLLDPQSATTPDDGPPNGGKRPSAGGADASDATGSRGGAQPKNAEMELERAAARIKRRFGVLVRYSYDAESFFMVQWRGGPVWAKGSQIKLDEALRIMPTIEVFLSKYPLEVTPILGDIFLLRTLSLYGLDCGSSDGAIGIYIASEEGSDGTTNDELLREMHAQLRKHALQTSRLPRSEMARSQRQGVEVYWTRKSARTIVTCRSARRTR